MAAGSFTKEQSAEFYNEGVLKFSSVGRRVNYVQTRPPGPREAMPEGYRHLLREADYPIVGEPGDRWHRPPDLQDLRSSELARVCNELRA